MAQRTVFKNGNGFDYFIIAGTDERAFMREMSRGGYVITRDLDWRHMRWNGGSYFGADEFEAAVKAFLEVQK